ncbi:MAG TPA: AraC family transcriptional regulator [Gemmatimonadales bacterium]|nr:AraC family transcriptional regulator [Gemmatimonadales bacterium]
MNLHTRGPDFGSKIKVLDVGGVRMAETLYAPHQEIPPHATTWPDLCLALAGGYEERLGQTRLRCDSVSLVFHPAGDVHSDRISDRGSRCLTVQIDPSLLPSGAARVSPDGFTVPRRAVPTRLAFELAAEFELRDDLSAVALESAVLALLGELASRPGLELRGAAPAWLERTREQVHDEFAKRLPLETLARTAGVHRVHLARAFRAHFGCTVGHYIRQRRLEFACRELVATPAPLSEIALSAGFADQSHFTNTFTHLIRMTPGAFRSRFTRR